MVIELLKGGNGMKAVIGVVNEYVAFANMWSCTIYCANSTDSSGCVCVCVCVCVLFVDSCRLHEI